MTPEQERPAPLSVRLGPVRLPNPVLTASGTFGYGAESPGLTATRRLGGIVTKTVTLEPRAGNPPPRLAETPAGLLNSIGLQNVGVEAFCREKLPRLRELGMALIVSVGGRRPEEYAEVARRLSGEPGIMALEVNISCPNVKEGGLEFCQSEKAAAEVIAGIRRTTGLPLWIKLSPNVTRIGDLARVVEDNGGDGITAVNTFVGLSVDVRTRRSRLWRGSGGLSGPAIRPLALAKVHEVVRHTRLPVIGAGGIATAQDALEFLIVGARAVQIGTALFRDPAAGALVVEGLQRYLEEQKLESIEQLIGTYIEGGAH